MTTGPGWLRRLLPVPLVILGLAPPVGRTCAQGAPGFTDVTAASGVSFVYKPTEDTPGIGAHGGGTEGDFDGDGWPDLFVVGGGQIRDALFLNDGDGTFTNGAAGAGLTLLYRGNGANAADFDRDGDLDIYVTSFGDASGPPKNGQQKLWRNAGDGTFVDVAVEAGVNSTGFTADGSGACWGDYDQDGDLDLFVAGWFLHLGLQGQNKLFRSNLAQTGTADFEDVTDELGLFAHDMRGFGGIFADMDGDRWPELLVAADYGSSQYYRNDRDGTFTEQWPMLPGDTKVESGMGTCLGDFNRDGLLDWFITAIYPSWLGDGPSGNRLYMNQGEGQFLSLPESAGVNDGGWGWGAATIDFDQDGWQDLVMTNGWWSCPDVVTGACFANEPSYLFRNNGDETFTEVHAAMNLVNTYQGRGLITFDYDRDGDMDVVILSNPKANAIDPPLTGNLALYRNDVCGPTGPAPGANFLVVSLDTASSADLAPHGLGADVRARTGTTVQLVDINGGSNYVSRSQLVAHFGLGGAAFVDELSVTWPNGDVSVLAGVPANQMLTVSSSALTWDLIGLGKAGSNGVPELMGQGPLLAGSPNQIDLQDAAPSASATLVFGLSAVNAPFKGGLLVPVPDVLVPLQTGADGGASLPFVLPQGTPPGIPLHFQFWISDPLATQGLSASNGLRGVTS